MRDPRIELREDHLLIELAGPEATLAPHREIVIPFSDIVEARAEPPRWPSAFGQWQIATYLPGVVAVGDFHAWDGADRLLAFDRKTKETLTLRLAGHPQFDEVRIQASAAKELAQAVARQAAAATDAGVPWRAPAPRE